MNIKEEICTLDFPLLENIAELSGYIRSSWKKDINKIDLFTENAKVAKRLSLLIKNVYGIDSIVERRKLANFRNKKIYVVIIENKVLDILKDLSLIDDNNQFIDSPKEYITGSLEEEKAYIRGSFLSKGSITDPNSGYHLEMLYDNKYEAVFIQRLLNNFELNSKIIIRDTKYMVYIKEAEKISDFLKILGVTKEFLYYENVRVEKEEKNITNRLNNCEQANIDKIIMTASRTIKEIDELIGVPDTQDGGVGYKAHELHQYEKFYGRLVIKYHKDSRPQVRRYAALKDKLEVLEILNDMYTGDHFPGYDKIRLSYSELERIIRRQLPEWIAALSNQKAVYLITDKFTGKMYVGSATSDNGMLLRRWGDYVANGHGGNQQLVELIKQKGFQYVKDNFVYSVLENYNARVDDSYILGRENWWKETLLTKKFGYNDN